MRKSSFSQQEFDKICIESNKKGETIDQLVDTLKKSGCNWSLSTIRLKLDMKPTGFKIDNGSVVRDGKLISKEDFHKIFEEENISPSQIGLNFRLTLLGQERVRFTKGKKPKAQILKDLFSSIE